MQIPYDNTVVISANINTLNSSQLKAFNIKTTSLYKSNLNNYDDNNVIK